MSNLNFIISKLNLKSPSIELSSKAHGGFSSSDVAAALAGLDDDIAFKITYMYLTGERQNLTELNKDVLNQIKRLSKIENWKIPKKTNLLDKFSRMAIGELLLDKLCRKCSGNGSILDEITIKECNKCKGTGVGNKFTDQMRADFFGFKWRNYMKYWKIRYNKSFHIAYSKLQNGLIHASRRLK